MPTEIGGCYCDTVEIWCNFCLHCTCTLHSYSGELSKCWPQILMNERGRKVGPSWQWLQSSYWLRELVGNLGCGSMSPTQGCGLAKWKRKLYDKIIFLSLTIINIVRAIFLKKNYWKEEPLFIFYDYIINTHKDSYFPVDPKFWIYPYCGFPVSLFKFWNSHTVLVPARTCLIMTFQC